MAGAEVLEPSARGFGECFQRKKHALLSTIFSHFTDKNKASIVRLMLY